MNFEVVVVGGGLAGAALARALAPSSLALIAQRRPGADPPRAGFDARVYAISPGNAGFLARIGAWQELPAGCATPVHGMRIFGDDGSSCIEFDAYRTGVEALAWIVEDRLLQGALWRTLERPDGPRLFAPADCEEIEFGPDAAAIALSGGRALRARLVVGADGARSFVRAEAGIGVDEAPYGHTAVVANFACAKPHRNIAYQWFRNGPVLALLPLPGDHVSMVWSTDDADAARLRALAPAELCAEVARASRHALGELALATPPRAFPLARSVAARMVAPRAALLGDAAHVVHPLAGQGANLGLQDARVLAHTLAARAPLRDPGDLRLLRRYERGRAEAILAMRATVHGLFRLFEAKGPLAARLRNAGLNLTERAPVLKNLLIRQAML